MNNNKNDKGFTLVELLIVIVILGILATVTVFAVRGITDQGQTNACKTEAKTIVTAAEAYYAQEGAVPVLADLVSEGYLTDSPAARFTLTGGDGSTAASVTGIGDCAPA